MKDEQNTATRCLKCHLKQQFNELNMVYLRLNFSKSLLINNALCTTNRYKAKEVMLVWDGLYLR